MKDICFSFWRPISHLIKHEYLKFKGEIVYVLFITSPKQSNFISQAYIKMKNGTNK